MKLMTLMIMLTLSSTAFSQKPHNTAATYENKITFLNTEINFNNFKANNECVGMVMFINKSSKPVTIKEINNECSCFYAVPEKKTVWPNEKGIITYHVKNPSKGVLKKKSFIIFNEIKQPIQVVIRGKFI